MIPETDYLSNIFPVYLSDASKERLAECLAQRDTNHDYHANGWEGPEEPIQGDGWTAFILLDFDAGDRRSVGGIVLSNSCDIDTSNASMRPRNVLFAPLIKIEDYARRLSIGGLSPERIENHLRDIRKQEKTEIFFVPAGREIPDSIVMLDDVHSQPLHSFLNIKDGRRKLFRLNNFGFYMFLMKLSIHFTRFGEKLDRAPSSGGGAVAV